MNMEAPISAFEQTKIRSDFFKTMQNACFYWHRLIGWFINPSASIGRSFTQPM